MGKAFGILPFMFAVWTGGVVVIAPGSTENAAANGDTRTISLHHAHTQESITATYLVNGQYDPSVLDKLNWFLRDWRRDEATKMDPRLFDTIWEVYRESGSSQPIDVMSAYRSPETNAMLRRRSRAVAEHSQHILGKAMDQHYVDVPMSRIREIAMKLQRGGVGFYPTAGTPFVHMDVGGVRHWPRMSYDQLARLFPDGKTVHIPSNGQPLPGYEEARAELEARGDSFAYPTATEVKSKSFFAWLFGGSDEDEDTAAAAGGGSRRGQQRVASLDRGSTGSVQPAKSSDMMGKDAGVRSFFASAAPPSSSGFANPQQPRMASQAPVRQASLEPTSTEPSDAAAQRALAQAIADQARQKAAADAAAKLASTNTETAAAGAPGPKAHIEDPTQALAAPDATLAPTAPMPPRRPVELASEGPSAPLPPNRPTELAGLAPAPTDRAPGVKAPKVDPIGSLIGTGVAARAAGLPAAITQGKPATPPAVLAFASPGLADPNGAMPPPRAYVPLPVARPTQFVAARLDRSNFRSLTGSSTAVRASGRSALGSSVTAIRSAAGASLATLAGQPSTDRVQGFGSHATDLSSDHFTGTAVKSREHVVTTGLAGAPSGPSPD